MFFICILIAVFLLLFSWKDTRKPDHFPPGPNWLPLVGVLPLLSKLHGHLKFYHLIWHRLTERYGPIVGLRIGRDKLIIISGREMAKEFYQLDEFNGRPDGFFFRIRSFNQRLGIVFTDGHFWAVQRKFSMKALRQLGMGRSNMIWQIEKEAIEMIDFFRMKSKNGTSICMQNAFDVPVLNVIWALMAGYRFQLEDERLPMILKMIHESFRVIDMSGGVINQFPIIRYIAPDWSGYRPLVKLLQPLWDFLKDIIADIRCNLKYDDPASLIEAFLVELEKTSTQQVDASFTEPQLLSLCLDLFQAGTETTSNTLSFAILYMLHNDSVQQKVVQELDRVVGPSRLPNLVDRIQLPYTEAVLCEIQRYANVAPVGITHRATETIKLGEYIIPKDTLALVSLYSLHMDIDYWTDPHVFRPERFLDENQQIIQHECFLPFGAGKRRCMGENLAKSSLFLYFASMMHSFNIKIASTDELPDVEGFDGITLSPKPFNVILTPRI